MNKTLEKRYEIVMNELEREYLYIYDTIGEYADSTMELMNTMQYLRNNKQHAQLERILIKYMGVK